jgi:hypothetical protein
MAFVDTGGAGAAPNAPSTGLSTSSPLSLGSLGTAAAGGAGLAGLLTLGSTALPWEYGALTANVPQLEQEATTLEGQGQTLTGQGSQALSMAQNGQLTQPQQAALGQYQSGLTNTADQIYASMGRNANQDTSYISTQADIDAKVNAMAQAEIQSTIQLGLGETQAGNSYDSTALGFENAANQALIAAGQAQVQSDAAYSSALSGVFSAVGTIAGGAVGAMAGGPVGAVAGATIGSKL